MFAGFLFLTPVITLLYKYTGLGLIEITLIANVATICMWLFELPTSVLADVVGRRPSLMTAVFFNLLGALTILLFPQFWGFIAASVFAACYWSFWSGTGQAFLEENLRILGEEKSFGKVIGRFMFAEQFAGLLCPLVAAGILYVFADGGYTILAAFDVVGAIILVILTFLLREAGDTVPLEKEEKKIHRYPGYHDCSSAWPQVFRKVFVYSQLGNWVTSPGAAIAYCCKRSWELVVTCCGVHTVYGM